MFWSLLLRQALRALWRNRLRSFLTLLGIMIGVASFICVVGVGSAGSAQVEDQLHSLGDNMIWIEAGSRSRNGVRAGARGTRSLVLEDARSILAQVPQITMLSPNVDGHTQVVYGNLNWGTGYRGVTPEYAKIRRWDLAEGLMFTQEDVDRAADVCVLGASVVENLFPGEDPLGKTVRVAGLPCKVIGTLQAKGATTEGRDQDDFVMLPFTTVQKKITGEFWLDDIFCSAVSDSDIPVAEEAIISILRERHHLGPDEDADFNIRRPQALIEARLAASRVLTLLLAGVASLSLLVGGIGVMNIMLVSVTERTREIGIRLAVGATGHEIRFQFLAEAVVISLLGGILGMVAAFGAALLLERILGWQLDITAAVVVVGGAFSIVLGTFFGFYPANRAAQLDPIEALRYE